MTYLQIEPHKNPIVKEGNLGLEEMQAAVDGYIECCYPYDEQIALVVNEEGKINGMELNRGLRDESGELYGAIAGTFLVVGYNNYDFCSLTPEQVEKYSKLFWQPELFININGRGHVIPEEI